MVKKKLEKICNDRIAMENAKEKNVAAGILKLGEELRGDEKHNYRLDGNTARVAKGWDKRERGGWGGKSDRK